jgi:AcrR family transcriptional regulator
MSRNAARPVVRLGREERVGHILQAAREAFCEKGYENTAVAEIAERVGVVEGTVYKYFESKRELLLRVLENWYEEMFGDYARDLAGIAGTRARLRLLIWRHLRSIKDYPLLCRLMFREVRSERDYHGSALHTLNRRYTQLLIDVLDEGARSGDFRSGLPMPLLRDMVYGSIEHYTWNFVCGRGELDIDQTAEQITALLCDGIEAQHTPAVLRLEAQRLVSLAETLETNKGRDPVRRAQLDSGLRRNDGRRSK